MSLPAGYPQQLRLPVDEMRPNPWNTNIVSPDNEAKLDASIRRMGMFKPVVVREVETHYEIIGGEHRWGAAKRLGMTEIPVINLGPIDDKLAKEIGLADNARYGADDMLSLAGLLESIGDEHELSSYLPYTETDLHTIFASVNIDVDSLDYDEKDDVPDVPDDIPAPTKAPKTHTVMRFKVPLGDSERLAKLIAETQKRQGFTESDDLTNAGDALVHLLLGGRDGDEE